MRLISLYLWTLFFLAGSIRNLTQNYLVYVIENFNQKFVMSFGFAHFNVYPICNVDFQNSPSCFFLLTNVVISFIWLMLRCHLPVQPRGAFLPIFTVVSLCLLTQRFLFSGVPRSLFFMMTPVVSFLMTLVVLFTWWPERCFSPDYLRGIFLLIIQEVPYFWLCKKSFFPSYLRAPFSSHYALWFLSIDYLEWLFLLINSEIVPFRSSQKLFFPNFSSQPDWCRGPLFLIQPVVLFFQYVAAFHSFRVSQVSFQLFLWSIRKPFFLILSEVLSSWPMQRFLFLNRCRGRILLNDPEVFCSKLPQLRVGSLSWDFFFSGWSRGSLSPDEPRYPLGPISFHLVTPELSWS